MHIVHVQCMYVFSVLFAETQHTLRRILIKGGIPISHKSTSVHVQVVLHYYMYMYLLHLVQTGDDLVHKLSPTFEL